MSVSWSNYARVYDLMASSNPAYQDLLVDFESEIRSWPMDPNDRIADLGAGTGNFSLIAGTVCKQGRVLHIDGTGPMIDLAKEKAAKASIENMEFQQADLETLELQPDSFSSIVSVHTLYTLKDPQRLLREIQKGLRPGGRAYLCDLGRVLDVGAWRRFIVRACVANIGWPQTLLRLVRGRAVARENQRIAMMQKEGRYWTHSLETFSQAVEASGLRVIRKKEVYRGDSDLVVAVKGG
jgi:ubiquinone/menaquinone biosynthesis C-methylase UbiE